MRRLLPAIALYFLLGIVAPGDTLRLSPVGRLAAPYQYNFLAWEITHLPAKWLRWAGEAVLPFRPNTDIPMQVVERYFRLEAEVRQMRERLSRTVAAGGPEAPRLERELRELEQRRDELRPRTEATLEAAISSVLAEEGIPFRVGKVIFPPVDFALDDPPTVLVVSPRDRIVMKEQVYLRSDISTREQEGLEEAVLGREDLSALVEGVGGISTYPSMINPGDLRHAASVASHEWLHQYLFLRPLGQNYRRSPEMDALNETLANLVSEELADRVVARLRGEPVPPGRSGPRETTPETCPPGAFCFGREMRFTRLQVEALLAQGRVEEAEAYMEERRQTFVREGYPIRKLNQAYFAFHGTYADSPASTSPIFGQLQRLRRSFPSLAGFVHALASVSRYEEFEGLLQERAPAP
ncbi:MAG: hypothetical protein HY535_01015 [Chloroflexi bacterium]|nr:hypothetical protein [Chloroflexota bacterium]